MFTQYCDAMHPPSHGFESKTGTLAFVLALTTLWLLLRGYHGLIGDAQIYAFQALARIFPQFQSDLYLQNTSQDQFTIFSPVYSWVVRAFGLEPAGRFLTLLFTFGFLVSAWKAARAFTNQGVAWLAVGFLLIIPGSYGGSGVFQFADQFLTARLPAEALIVCAIAFHLWGRKRLALATATGALLVHPLIALPGIVLLLSLSVSAPASAGAAVGCVLVAAVTAAAATRFSWLPHVLTIMDDPWVHVVQERSQFLFLQLWSFRDWELNVRPFFYLAFTAFAVEDYRIRRLSVSAALVGATGLALGLLAGAIGPVAVLVQGQPWRWVWIATFLSILLLPLAVLRTLEDKNCGPLCAILLVCGWTFPAVDGMACVSLAMLLWLMRARFGIRSLWAFRFFAGVLGLAIVGWTATQSGKGQLQNISDLRVAAALGIALVWVCVRRVLTLRTPLLLCCFFLASSIYLMPAGFKQSRSFGDTAAVEEFSDWRDAIPPTSSVLVVPSRDVGSFVWFTLRRPNYLAIDQSAGTVFSRMTALEVQRRSNVLLTIKEPDWKIMTRLHETAGGRRTIEPETHPLTAVSLKQICADPKLGFVIAKQDFGIKLLRHQHVGAWKDWNLYDCLNVRQSLPPV